MTDQHDDPLDAPPPAELPPRAEQALDELEARLREGELRIARRALEATRALCGPRERARFDALERRLGLQERLEGPTLDYETAIARGDSLGARDAALRAAAVASGEETAPWRARSEEADARVRAEWRICQAEVDVDATGPTLAACASLLEPTLDEAQVLLADDGATLVLVSAWERWVFVREVDVERRRVLRIGWLRAPAPLDDPTVQVDGDSIHLVDSVGHLLSLSRRSLEVVRWLSLRPFMLPDRSVSDACVVPPGRHLWAQFKEPYEEGGLAVIDLKEWRVCGRIHGFDYVAQVAGARPERMVATSQHETAALYDERGVRIAEPSLENLHILQLVAHPDCKGLLALVAAWESDEDEDEDDDAEPPLGLVELRPGRPPSSPLVLPGTHFEQVAHLAVSLAAQRAFLLTNFGGRNQLVAYRQGPQGLEEAWRVEVPDLTVFARDGASRTVLALAPTARGVEFRVLGQDPIHFEQNPFGHLALGMDEPPFHFCEMGQREESDLTLRLEADRQRRDGNLERWAETCRRQRRKDPTALAELIGVVLSHSKPEIAERLLALSYERHPAHPQLLLREADVAAARGRWDEAERLLAGLDSAAFPEPRACHLHHLRGLARLHAGDSTGARECFEAGARLSRSRCSAEWNLDLAGALWDPPEEEPEEAESALHQVARACRIADLCLARGDDAAARDALDCPVVHARLELQSAARLAEAHLAHEPATPQETLAKLVALRRISGFDPARPKLFSQIPGLGWDAQRLAAVAVRGRAWLDDFARPPLGLEPSPAPTPAPARPEPPSPKIDRPGLREPHHLPPLGHEVMGQLVPGLDAAVREAARYARGQPGWDETQTLGEDLLELAPVRWFLASNVGAIDHEEALLGRHLDYCVNFELGRRKCFFVDGPLAWLLGHTSLDIEGRVLRLPFPCFALVFTDRETLELAEALLLRQGGDVAEERLQIMTAYVTRIAARRGMSGLRLSLVLDARGGAWPQVLGHELRFSEDDDLDAILESAGDTRTLVHLVLSAILYATSANVPWPLAPSPIRTLKAKALGRGNAKRARVAHRAQELGSQYSDEDVFFLPGRIPISQLRALQEIERGPKGAALMARFMVRGHWRRAARGWADQRLRWIEPYWKGPELGPITEKEYRLKI